MELLGPPGRDHGLVAPVRARRGAGDGPSRREVAGPGWRRSSSGLYVPSDVPQTALQRTLEAGVLVPRYGAVTGWAALGWQGGRWFGGLERDGSTPRPVPLAVSRHRIRRQPGITICEERFDPRESLVVDGIVVTDPVRSTAFDMRYAGSVTGAVVVLDMAAYNDLVSIEEMAVWILEHPSYTGIGLARQALTLADENSWSPMEVVARVAWVVDAARPAPVTNRPVFDLDGRHLMTPDLIDPEAGVAVEYDGVVHADLLRRRKDRQRNDLYRDHRIEWVSVMSGDLRDPFAFARRLHTAYERAEHHRGPRTWTLEQPSWWVDTSTVERRRALARQEVEIWLAYRAAG